MANSRIKQGRIQTKKFKTQIQVTDYNLIGVYVWKKDSFQGSQPDNIFPSHGHSGNLVVSWKYNRP